MAAGEARVIDIQVSGTGGDSHFEDINYMQAAVFDNLTIRQRIITARAMLFWAVTEQPTGGNVSDPTKEELMARIAELEKQVGTKKTGRMEFRVSEKGGVSVYGLGRFPVTLYYEQWQRLLAEADNLRAFLEENKGKLKLKAVE